ncbi:MAG: hypothetical protein H6639_00525 [Caldilineaceae bacterium]|nr:hypothetical protein [Caldilineaceae bacterium]
MIHWLVSDARQLPEILRGDAAPAGKRRSSERSRRPQGQLAAATGLLGRRGQNLVQRYLAQSTAKRPPLDTIFISADDDGAPYTQLRGEGRGRGKITRLVERIS